MSEQQHTNELWHFVDICGPGIHSDTRVVVPMGYVSESDARRIVAAYNACSEVSTSHLEKVGSNWGRAYADLLRYSNNMKKQRDSLLAELKEIQRFGKANTGCGFTCAEMAEKAIKLAVGSE